MGKANYVALLVVIAAAPSIYAQGSDTKAPTLVSFSFTPATVNTGSNAATVMATFTASDDLSGVDAVAVTFFNPSQTVWYGNTASFNGQLQVSGTVSITLPQFSAAGVWTPTVELVDKAGNVRLMSATDVAALGFPTRLTVAAQNSDTKAPTLVSFSFTPATVNTGSNAATVMATFTASDDLSGVDAVAVTFFNPSQTVWYGNTASFNGQLQVSGTVSITLPQFSAAGVWTPTVELVDKAGNVRLMSATDVAAQGFPSRLTVASASASGNISVSPTFLAFNYQSPGNPPPSQTIFLSTTSGPMAFTASGSGGNWLSVSPAGGTTPASLSVSVNPSGLSPGTYSGTITISAPGASNSPQTVSVSLAVTSAPKISASPSLLNYAYQNGGNLPQAQAITVSATRAVAFTVAASGGSWLSVSPTGAATPASLSVSVNPAGLNPGTYNGTITITASGASDSPQTVSVNLAVTSAPAISVNPSLLNYAYQSGGSPPQAQAVTVSATSAAAFTAAASGGSWLTVNPTSGTTPAILSVSVSPTGLSPGTYNGTITITAPGAGNSPQTVSVSLTVASAPTISVSPSLLNFAYQSGGSPPQAQTVTVSATSAAAFTAAASGGSWLAVNPTSGTTPASLSVSVSPAGLNPGTYNGTISVTGTNGAQGTLTVNVTLTVTASLPPLPTIDGVTNAASYATGAVSPGELVTLFGTAIGPATAASATTDPATGKLATTIGGVQVLFNGTAAPMIYASSTQVSAVVPYEMASVASPGVWIKYAGQTSNSYQLTTTTTAPGLFTQNSAGSGLGAILNQDNSVNGPGNRAAKGSTVQVFMTGEGQTSPPSVTGAITAATLPPPQVTPGPLLAVGVTINGLPALYVYAGEAPGLVAGMMQLNVQIPANAASGDLPIVVSIGGKASQNGVTVSVQ